MLTIGERIKEIRKELDLNQTDFGAAIGLKQTAIGMYETNQRAVSERSIISICKEFNINEEWLREGTGKMFVERSFFSLDDYAKAKNLSELDKEVIKNFMELDPDTRHSVYDVIIKAFAISEADSDPDPIADAEAAYIKSRSDTAQNTDSSASNTA